MQVLTAELSLKVDEMKLWREMIHRPWMQIARRKHSQEETVNGA